MNPEPTSDDEKRAQECSAWWYCSRDYCPAEHVMEAKLKNGPCHKFDALGDEVSEEYRRMNK